MHDSLSPWPGAAPIAIVLGSGLAGACDRAMIVRRVSYADLPGFAEPSVPGHPGFLAFASFAGRRALLFAGRAHAYEGGEPGRLASAASLAASLGCRRIVFTNAAGSLDPAVHPGSWLVASDVVAFPARAALPFAADAASGAGPARGRYRRLVSPRLRRALAAAARRAGSRTVEGVLAWMPGPCYETAAEARAAAAAGASAATMSVFPELVAALRSGLESAVLSRVVNFAPNVGDARIDHADVVRRSAEACGELASIIEALLVRPSSSK